MPSHEGAAILSLLLQFEQSQWWSGEKLHKHQFAQLESLLSFASASVPFYRERLSASGWRARYS